MLVCKNIFIIGTIFLLVLLALPVAGQSEKPNETQKLSEIDWDEEGAEEETTSSETGIGGINWDEEGEDASEGGKSSQRPIKRIKSEAELFSHWFSGILFFIYLSGCFLTAYFTRNKPITLKTPPEFLIVLHIFWPLELILIPFFKK